MVLATSATADKTQMDLKSCQNIASTLKDVTELPLQCQAYPSVVEAVKQKHDEQAMAIAFAGMKPGSAVQARRSRVTGYESNAKLQRRLTSSGTDHRVHPQKAP